ncbi:MAG: formylglycine-generating enzyme family protein, partial [Planctomycetota bacterium]|nr:formylglycine-generating enzyme family protein [Planctomycetota bacterium]
SAAKQSCRALRDFLVRYPEVRCVVSGRPYAIRRYWDLLFEPQGTWQFVKVDVFTHDECRQFVGPERLAHLTRLGADVISVPRALEMIQQIPVKFLPSLRTTSDVYWKSLEGMLEEALKNQADHVGWPLHQTRRLFALLAFEMLRCGYRAGEAGIKGGEDATSFMARILAAQGPLLRSWLDIENRAQLEQHLVQLLAVNEILADPVLAGRGKPEVVHFLWRNQALMDMFAALWLTRYANEPADYRWFHQQLGERASRELCKLTVEMPLAEPKATYVKAMSVVFTDAVRPPEPLPPRNKLETSPRRRTAASLRYWGKPLSVLFRDREPPAAAVETPSTTRAPKTRRRHWTEWIYRSWPNLLQIAGYLREPGWTDDALRAATWAAQREARRCVELNRELSDANAARELLLQFLGEFPLIKRGSRGTAAQRVAAELERGLVRVPPDDACSHTCPGNVRKATPSVEIEPFWLGAMPVTNVQYELFDPAHQQQHGRASPGDTCPAIEVCWYDAWCYAVWSGGRLPTEEEWEYACRAGSAGAWCFGDDDQRLNDYAWYYSNAGGQTQPVGSKAPNIWGLHDLHGNVWEWCDSWYDESRTIRVFRGGSWKSPLEDSRSAYRNGSSPSFQNVHVGFRVAAVPARRQIGPAERR